MSESECVHEGSGTYMCTRYCTRPMTQAADAMKLARSAGISLKEAWAQIKGQGGTGGDDTGLFDNPDTTEERKALGIPAKEGE